jgi:PAS domain S-box-containing protein
MPLHRASEKWSDLRSREIVYTLDLDGNFTFLNKVGEQLWGYTCEEIRRMNIAQIVAPEFARQIRDELSTLAAEPFGLVYEIEVLTRDGRRLALETSAHLAFRNEKGGEIQGIAVPIHNAPERPIRCLDSKFEFGFTDWTSN